MGKRKRVVSTTWAISDVQLAYMHPGLRDEYMALREDHARAMLSALAAKAGRIVPPEAVEVTRSRSPWEATTLWHARARTLPRPDWKKPRKRP